MEFIKSFFIAVITYVVNVECNVGKVELHFFDFNEISCIYSIVLFVSSVIYISNYTISYLLQ